jgi:hypothetical protein
VFKRFMQDNRGLESMEIVVVGGIVIGLMAMAIITLMNSVQTTAGNETTAVQNCVPTAPQDTPGACQ